MSMLTPEGEYAIENGLPLHASYFNSEKYRKCDYCNKIFKNRNKVDFYRQTNALICNSKLCWEKANESWVRHCAEMEEKYKRNKDYEEGNW